MVWQQVVISLCARDAVRVESALTAAGAIAITFSDAGNEPLFEPAPGETPLWSSTEVTALFDDDTDTDAAICEVSRVLGPDRLVDYRVIALEDREWEREWLADFRPTRFGEKLWVCPHGQTSGKDGAIELILDPGLAFGTGSHETTAMCLEWLDRETTESRTILDYGCGSGILAIAGLLLGAKKAVATDIDPQALTATRANALENNVQDRLAIVPVDSVPPSKHDLVIANILAGTLMDLAATLARLTAAGGLIGLSGILADQADEVGGIFSQWYELAHPAFRGDWSFLTGRRL